MSTNKYLIYHWAKFAHKVWAKKQPPWKPSKGELKLWEGVLEKVMKTTKHPKVLILGATPEFRVMLAKYPAVRVTLVDVSRDMKRAMDMLTKRKPKYEQFIQANWLSMPFKDQDFDIVIGDTPHHNIKKGDYFKFFKEVRRVLIPIDITLCNSTGNGKM